MRHAAITLVLIGVAARAAAQSASPAFEVASIKQNKLDSNRVNLNLEPGGRFVATNVSLQVLIAAAYGDGPPLAQKLKRSDVDCTDPRENTARNADGTSKCGFRTVPGKASGRQTMSVLTRLFSNAVADHRLVEDRTGLEGTYDFELEWLPEVPVPADGPPAPPIDPGAPSIFTAAREQLGLKLEPAKSSIDILVVDHAEHPTEN